MLPAPVIGLGLLAAAIIFAIFFLGNNSDPTLEETAVRTNAVGQDGLVANVANTVNFLYRNDAYHFFEPLGDLIKTGPTHTNVCDVRVVIND